MPGHRRLRLAAGEPAPALRPRGGTLKPTHATVLTALAPLADGAATGRQFVARRGGVLVTAELAQAGIRDDTFNGIRVRTVLRETGAELGSNRFDFDAHDTVPRPGFVHTLHDLDRMHRFGELAPKPLRAAIGQYLDLYTDAPVSAPHQHRAAPTASHSHTARPARMSAQSPPRVLVSPLYLAGPDGPRDQATAPLLQRGWTAQTGRLRTTYTSPSALLRVEARTDTTGPAWIITGHHDPGGPLAWRAAADAKTPPEAIVALNTAVAQLPGSDDPGRALPPSSTALDPLIDAGWRRFHPNDIVYIEPVHGLARIDRGAPAAHHAFRRSDWFITAGRLGIGPRAGWHIEMSAHIPSPLLAAVTGALLDLTPVERPQHSLADEHLPYLDIARAPTRDRPLAASRTSAARGSTTTAPAHPAPAPAPTTPQPAEDPTPVRRRQDSVTAPPSTALAMGLAQLAQNPGPDSPASRLVTRGLLDIPGIDSAFATALTREALRPAALEVARAMVGKLIDEGEPWTHAAASWLSRAGADWQTSAQFCNGLAWQARSRHNSAGTHLDGTDHLRHPCPDPIHAQALRHLQLTGWRYDFRCRTITDQLADISQSHRSQWDPYTRALQAFALLGQSKPEGFTAMRDCLDEAGDNPAVVHALLHGLWLGDGLTNQAEEILRLAAWPTLADDDPVMLFRSATALRLLGRRDEALEAVHAAMEQLGPNAPEFHADLVRERSLITLLPRASRG
ncbi:DUF317 domain-containing protein [Kitasatospora sp. Root107]|nr:DUF317 domain-containing protein [Kitasatospora sp. Root107]KQV20966.1 hypothetical protein ASC99_20925 [Kitasatospora sp. Root107]